MESKWPKWLLLDEVDHSELIEVLQGYFSGASYPDHRTVEFYKSENEAKLVIRLEKKADIVAEVNYPLYQIMTPTRIWFSKKPRNYESD